MEVRNFRFSDNTNTNIDCEVLLNGEWVPYTASANDPEAFCVQVYESIKLSGANIQPWVDPTIPEPIPVVQVG